MTEIPLPKDGQTDRLKRKMRERVREREREREREILFKLNQLGLLIMIYLQCLQPYILFQGSLFHSAVPPSCFPGILSDSKWRLPQAPKPRSVGRRQYQPIPMNDCMYLHR